MIVLRHDTLYLCLKYFSFKTKLFFILMSENNRQFFNLPPYKSAFMNLEYA